jgi:basic membrane protein A and related proteins
VKSTLMRRARLVPAIGALAVLVAACGSSGSSTSSAATTATTAAGTTAAGTTATTAASSSGTSATKSDMTACLMISNEGIDDHGFNAESWSALQEASKQYGISIKYLEESGSVTWATMGSEFVSEGCKFIVGEGFDTEEEIQTLAAANPSIKFALIDDSLTKSEPNAVSLVYQTQQAAFLAGYLSAGYSKAKAIGMFGNEPIPPVEDYLDGYYAGVEYYNKVNHASVKIIGWNPKTKTGEFMGSYTDTNKAQTIAAQELQQGADVIYPVGLPEAAAAAVKQAGGTSAGSVVWVDTDGCGAYPQYCDLQLTAVEKNITPSLFAVIKSAVDNKWKSGTYNGTLANDGVGLAPYHDFASKIPASLQKQVTALEAKIKSGAINPDPYSS